MPSSSRRGFTLVEILIVVVILAILAAIVIPQYSNASSTAKANSMLAQLQMVRGQLELYNVHHNGYPSLADLWNVLLSKTDLDGTISATGKFGPYIQQAPSNVFNNSRSVKAIGSGTATDGWEYDETTGQIRAVGFDEATMTFTAP